MTHRVNTAMKAMQTARLHAAVDALPAEPSSSQLRCGHHTVLSRRDPRDHQVAFGAFFTQYGE